LRSHPLFAAYAALVAVCFFWGTTYLAIRMALESFPPLLLVAARFLLSGALMLAGAALTRARLPRGRELWQTAWNGVLILGVGNGCLTFAELWIPSGLAALIVTTSPFWMVGLDALLPPREPLRAPVAAGILVGALGALLLAAPGAAGWDPALLRGILVLQVGCFSWSLGSIRQRRIRGVAHPVVHGAVQQLAAGLAFALPAALIPEPPVRWTAKGAGAILYLAVFGSIVGYSAYIYALDRLPVSLVSVYTYVNPVVAVVLGHLFYGEPFGLREAVAMGVIFAGVALVKHYSAPPAGSATAELSSGRAVSLQEPRPPS
jgi:drug/metabolite transporter (DMT)-like permease